MAWSLLFPKHNATCFIFYSFVEIEMRRAYRSFFHTLCACIEIGSIALFCLVDLIRRIKSGANIPRTAVLRGRAEKKGSRRTILTTKAAELLIRQFLCTHRAAQRRGIHEDIKLTILYRHHRPIGRFSDSCQYRLLGGFLTRLWDNLLYELLGGTFSHSSLLLYLPLILRSWRQNL